MKCSECEVEFNPDEPQHKKYGLYSECGLCGRRTEKKRKVKRTIGVQGGEAINKSANISIIRNPDKKMQAMVRAQNNSVFNDNLRFTAKVDREDRVEQEELKKEENKKVIKSKAPQAYELKK